ncbi:HTH-type transcriptional regulator ArgP [compost metagenome]
MNPSYRQLKAFLAATRFKNFTRASQQMHITQAGLSAMIKELEAQVGCRLLYRTTRLVDLTPEGQAFLPSAEAAVAAMDAALEAVQLVEGTRRPLRIAVTPLVANSLLPGALVQLRREVQGLNVEVKDVDPERIQMLVDAGTVDAGYGLFFRAASGMSRRALFSSDLVRVSPTMRARAPVEIAWQQLDGASLICLPKENPIQVLVDEHMTLAGANAARRMEVTHIETVIAMVASKLGVAVLPSICAGVASRYKVRLERMVQAADSLHYYCITRSGRPTPEHAIRLGELIGDALRHYEA